MIIRAKQLSNHVVHFQEVALLVLLFLYKFWDDKAKCKPKDEVIKDPKILDYRSQKI